MRLLCHAWLSPDCGLPSDSESLKVLSRLGVGWSKSEAKIRSKFRLEGERLFNDRLLAERTKQEVWREKSRQGGKSSGASRREPNVKGGSILVGECLQPNGNSSSPSPSSSPVTTEEKTPTESKRTVSPKPCSTKTHGSRFTESILPVEWCGWCMEDLGWEAAHALSVFDKFRDYWIAQPGVKGRKSDWLATWRNWCRKEAADEQKAVARNGGGSLFAPVAPRESATERSIRVARETVMQTGRL